MNLFKASKTSSRTYSKPLKPVVKRSNLWLKMGLIEGVTELRKSGLCFLSSIRKIVSFLKNF